MKIYLRLFPLFLLLNITSCKDEPSAPEESLSIDQKVEKLLAQMTLEEKIGQMTQAERNAVSLDDIKNYSLGSLLSGGGSAPAENSPFAWADMVDSYQAAALQSRLKIPLIYGVDAVHGHNNVYGAVIFPHNIGLGCTFNPQLVEEAARITAMEVAGTGIHWTFSPCIAVPRDERWGRTYEGFGETPELQTIMAEAKVRGYQGSDLSDPSSILACAKHFIGDGGTSGGIDQGDTMLDEQTLRKIHLPGYIAAIKAGVGSVMATYNSWNGLKVHGHKYLLTDLLKNELGFDGFVVSDYSAIDQLPGDYKSDIENSINAGIDMVMVPFNFKEFIKLLRELVNEGRVPMERIDDAARRILKIKYKLELFERPFANRSFTGMIGSNEHREIAKQCVRESLVLLKNENDILPLSKSLSRIHVAGKNANDIGSQCGGWTISWQGSTGNITPGTTILNGIILTASSSTNVTYSLDGTGAAGADAGIVVIGETPYAEGAGDRTNLALSSEDIQAINNMKSAGIPVVVILVSGRPMIIDPIINSVDAFVAAWLPGTEGKGVAEVLLGDYNFSGKLSNSWPRSMQQIPINVGDNNYSPLFPYGFGLKYSE